MEEVILPEDFNYFIPASQLAALRRKCLSPAPSPKDSGDVSSSVEHTTVTSSGKAKYPPIPWRVAGGEASDRESWRDTPLMQCRYCLRHELGYCVNHGGKRPEWKEPLSLRLADGRCFILQFDCSKCQMNVWDDNHK